MSSKINIIEVGIRDGLQVVDKFIPTEQKLDFINGFIDSGIKNIQVTSFVNPKKVPQTSDAEDLVKKLPVVNDVEYSALIFNQRGIERAIESGIKKVETSISLSSIYSKKNLGIGIDESIDKSNALSRKLKSSIPITSTKKTLSLKYTFFHKKSEKLSIQDMIN